MLFPFSELLEWAAKVPVDWIPVQPTEDKVTSSVEPWTKLPETFN